jgi:hypothetical protein
MRNFSRLALFSLVLAASGSAFADGGPMDRTFGLGLQLGVPTGVTGKVFFTPVVALAFGVGTLLPYGGFGTWADLDLHFVHFHTRKDRILRMSLYAGPGLALGWAYNYTEYYRGAYVGPGYVVYSGPLEVTIHGPIGFAIHWQRAAFDTFFELSPGITLVPDLNLAYFSMGGSVGARYYF